MKEVADMKDFCSLVGERGNKAGVIVTQRVDRNSTQTIQIPCPFFIKQLGPFSTDEDHRRPVISGEYVLLVEWDYSRTGSVQGLGLRSNHCSEGLAVGDQTDQATLFGTI